MAVAHLAIAAILDLQPGRHAAVSAVRAVRPLADDAFKVSLARHAKQIAAALVDVIEVQQPRLNGRHDAKQPALAFEQRQCREILRSMLSTSNA